MAEVVQAEPDAGGGSDLIAELERANAAAAKGPLAALLTPAATVLGRSLGEWAENITRKRIENIHAHVEAVNSNNTDTKPHNQNDKQEDLLEWAKEAQKIAPDNQLAELWQSVLDQIISSKSTQKRLIDAASKLDAKELEIIKKISIGNSDFEHTECHRLLKEQLIVENSTGKTLFNFINVSLIFALMLFSGVLANNFEFNKPLISAFGDVAISRPAFVFGVSLISVAVLFFSCFYLAKLLHKIFGKRSGQYSKKVARWRRFLMPYGLSSDALSLIAALEKYESKLTRNDSRETTAVN